GLPGRFVPEPPNRKVTHEGTSRPLRMIKPRSVSKLTDPLLLVQATPVPKVSRQFKQRIGPGLLKSRRAPSNPSTVLSPVAGKPALALLLKGDRPPVVANIPALLFKKN